MGYPRNRRFIVPFSLFAYPSLQTNTKSNYCKMCAHVSKAHGDFSPVSRPRRIEITLSCFWRDASFVYPCRAVPDTHLPLFSSRPWNCTTPRSWRRASSILASCCTRSRARSSSCTGNPPRSGRSPRSWTCRRPPSRVARPRHRRPRRPPRRARRWPPPSLLKLTLTREPRAAPAGTTFTPHSTVREAKSQRTEPTCDQRRLHTPHRLTLASKWTVPHDGETKRQLDATTASPINADNKYGERTVIHWSLIAVKPIGGDVKTRYRGDPKMTQLSYVTDLRIYACRWRHEPIQILTLNDTKLPH